MIDIIQDVSTITTIPKDALDKLVNKELWCICEAVKEGSLKNESPTEMDIGIGTLLISDHEETVKYKFIPSKALEESVNETIQNKKSPLELKLEKNLVNKILNTYKTIL